MATAQSGDVFELRRRRHPLPFEEENGWKKSEEKKEVKYSLSRIPNEIRDERSEAYQPRVVSIGPYYYGSSKLKDSHDYKQLAAEWLLLSTTRPYRYHSGPDVVDIEQLLKTLIDQIRPLETRVRSFYKESIDRFDTDALATMVAIDGCFILYILLCQVNLETDLEASSARAAEIRSFLPSKQSVIYKSVVRDLLLLENQIPFFAIQELSKHIQFPYDRIPSVEHLALNFCSTLSPPGNQPPSITQSHHLLHIYHGSLLPHVLQSSNNHQYSSSPQLSKTTTPVERIPSVTELDEDGVTFIKKDSTTTSFLDIEFYKGILQMPSMRISCHTLSIFRNLIAFEQCNLSETRSTYITDYASFMNYLIRTTEDVKVLHQNGIIIDSIFVDSEATYFFNNLVRKVNFDPDANYLRCLYGELSTYRKSRWHQWMITLARNYGNRPWITLATLINFGILILTFIQTFFTLYTYFKPQNN